ncbi:DUF3124 domain-containing protein [Lyngbya sp. CCY1209]|uniref:DUF3124 domain-containing protein n=1 Tax=Lyngbya sp. CCY1209 TaxID=2886103 RepID=UPI002D20BC0F|nr:DUF3124 domain-containing protein [Lyngbya sp. CCY1209]MEB3884827.1 DUF3124 domain-containing protein [Lyngbya sp. CCY1209]
MMKLSLLFTIAIAFSILTGCESPPTGGPIASESSGPTIEQLTRAAEPVDITQIEAIAGHTVYVPVYSHIYYRNTQQVYNLATTLSVRNTDLENPLIVTAVKYYNTEGNLVNSYLEQALKLPPLGSMDFFVEQSNTRGGSGANFIVEWISETALSEPVIEAVMVGVSGTQGLAFTSRGKTINN